MGFIPGAYTAQRQRGLPPEVAEFPRLSTATWQLASVRLRLPVGDFHGFHSFNGGECVYQAGAE